MSRKYIALIRHGDYHQKSDTPSAFQPYGLNEKGVEQARMCGGLLLNAVSEHKLTLHPEIHCSTLLRAWQTAEQIRLSLSAHVKLVQSEELCERSVGAMANLTITEMEEIVKQDPRMEPLPPGWKSDSYFQLPFPGAESLMVAGERVKNYIQKVMNQMQEGNLAVIVGHGASIRHAAHLLGILPFHKIDQLSMYHAQPVIFSWDSQHWQHLTGDWKVRKAKTEYTD